MSIKLLSRFKNYAALGLVLLAGNIAHAQPCIPPLAVNCTNSANSTWITNFKTTGAVVNINNTTACDAANSYFYFSTITCRANAGTKIGYSVTQSKSWQTGLGVWVDWGKDLSFGNGNQYGVNEKQNVTNQFFNGSTALASSTTPYEIKIPANIKQGIYRIRVRIAAGAAPPSSTVFGGVAPCAGGSGNYDNGETEEYNLEVINPCLPPGVTSVSNLSDRSATVSWSVRPNADMYEWLLDTSRTDPTSYGYYYTSTASVAFPSVDYPKLECNTKYYFHVRTICDTTPKPSSAWVYSPWTIDSFTTDQCCYIPPVTISQVGPTTAVATWTAVPSGYRYEYAVGTTGKNPPLTGGTQTNYTSVLLQGLPCNKESFFYLRALCSPTPYSEWGETSVVTLPCTSVDNVGGIAGGIEAYPNPAKDMITVKVKGWKTGDGNVVITDLTGKVVKTAIASTDIVSLSLDGLAPGFYLLKYTDPQRSEVIRINKQ